jgi:hypothetical protein
MILPSTKLCSADITVEERYIFNGNWIYSEDIKILDILDLKELMLLWCSSIRGLAIFACFFFFNANDTSHVGFTKLVDKTVTHSAHPFRKNPDRSKKKRESACSRWRYPTVTIALELCNRRRPFVSTTGRVSACTHFVQFFALQRGPESVSTWQLFSWPRNSGYYGTWGRW